MLSFTYTIMLSVVMLSIVALFKMASNVANDIVIVEKLKIV
jgi:hypothetical protein